MLIISLPSSGCKTETGIDYYGNDVSHHRQQPNVDACRRTCLAKKTGFFTWLPNKRCWCKNSDAGRRRYGSAVSGKTSCTGQLSSQSIIPLA